MYALYVNIIWHEHVGAFIDFHSHSFFLLLLLLLANINSKQAHMMGDDAVQVQWRWYVNWSCEYLFLPSKVECDAGWWFGIVTFPGRCTSKNAGEQIACIHTHNNKLSSKCHRERERGNKKEKSIHSQNSQTDRNWINATIVSTSSIEQWSTSVVQFCVLVFEFEFLWVLE